MSPRDAVIWQQVVDELANALQAAIGRAAYVRRNAEITADEAVQLESSIARAINALKRVQPPPGAKRGR